MDTASRLDRWKLILVLPLELAITDTFSFVSCTELIAQDCGCRRSKRSFYLQSGQWRCARVYGVVWLKAVVKGVSQGE